MAVSAVVVVAGCSAPAATSSASAHPSPTARPETPLVAVLDGYFGTVPNSVRLVDLGGRTVARLPLSDTDEAVGAGGRRVLVGGAGRLRSLGADGAVQDLGAVPFDGSGGLIRGLVVDPTGSRWLWSTVDQGNDGVADSRLWLGSAGTPPRQLAESVQPGRDLEPLAWTDGGAVVGDDVLGIGGYILFRRGFGPTSLLDTAAGTLRSLTEEQCAFNDLAADGTVTCVVGGHEGPPGEGPVSLRIQPPHGPATVVPMPAAARQAGAALVRPGGGTLAFAWSPATADGAEQIEMDLVATAGGAPRPFGPAGLIPRAWLPDGRLVAVRGDGVLGGAPGTWLVAQDGSATRLDASSTVVGVLG